MVLAGVAVAQGPRVLAHSDGDVLLHAVTDAILGALGEPDIGDLFPESDPLNAGRASREFLDEALRRAIAGGWVVVNLDATLVLEKPRLGAQKGAIRAGLASLLGLSPARVGLKAKSGEGLDAAGRGEAIEASAVVLLRRGAGGGGNG
jgi:2-C-methyl-D-erythritol 2,4-cyclodiphosphate synthase